MRRGDVLRASLLRDCSAWSSRCILTDVHDATGTNDGTCNRDRKVEGGATGASSGDASGGDTDWSQPTPGLQCCLSETVAGGEVCTGAGRIGATGDCGC